MGSPEQRLDLVERTLGGLTGKLDAFAQRLDDIWSLGERRNSELKQKLGEYTTTLEGKIQGIDLGGKALMSKMTGMRDNLDQRITIVGKEVIGITTGRITPIEDELKKLMGGVQQKIQEIEGKLSQSRNNQAQWTGSKPILEYKSITEIGKLNDNKSGYRDWKHKTKDALYNIYGDDRIREILDYLESPSTRYDGTEGLDKI